MNDVVRPRLGRPSLTWIVPVLCFVAIGTCWAFSTPAGAGVDEPSHFVRVIGMARGDIIGADVPADAPLPGMEDVPSARVAKEAGIYRTPGSLPEPYPCNFNDVTMPFACPLSATSPDEMTAISYHARYLPGAYVLPAVISRLGSNTWRTIVLARLGFLLQNAVLLAICVLALRRAIARPSSTALGALLLCVTPLIAFQSGTLAPNGTEILAVVAFLATFLAAVRCRSRGWLWTAAVVGSFACWTRDLGVADVLFFAVLAVLLVPGAAGWLWGRRRSVDVLAAALVVCAMAGATAWQLILKAPLDLGLDSPGKVLADLGRTIGLLGESVGLLGWLNIPIDRVVQTAWIIGWLVALIVLVRRTTRRAQLVGATVVVAYVVGNLVLMNALRRTDFGDQARFTIALPIALVVLLAVSQPATTGSPRRGLRRQWPLAVASVIAALGHLSGLLLSAQHNAVGLGRPMTFSATAWAPPGGWPLMLLAFALSCGSLLVLAPLAGRSTA